MFSQMLATLGRILHTFSQLQKLSLKSCSQVIFLSSVHQQSFRQLIDDQEAQETAHNQWSLQHRRSTFVLPMPHL